MITTTDDNGVSWAQEDETSPKVRTFLIPIQNMGAFNDALAKLGKRATKLGIPAPTYMVVKEDVRTHQVKTGRLNDDGTPEYVDDVRVSNYIILQHQLVQVAGYEFVSKLEHTEEGNIIHSLPGMTTPVQYRNAEPWCDHCQIRRRRNDTFVVRHIADDTYKQIGRNCLSDYLGKDAARVAAIAEINFTVGELAEASQDDSYGGGGYTPHFDMLEKYLAYVAEVISLIGWKSKSAARVDGGEATADVAYYHLHPSPFDKKKDRLFVGAPTPESFITAQQTIAWVEGLSDEEVEPNEYLYNLRVIARRGVVGEKQYGLSASMVSAYQRHLGDLKRINESRGPSSFVGEEEQRLVFSLLIDKVMRINSDWGGSNLHIAYDDVGNKFVWYDKLKELEVGKRYALRGTIKKHEERQGVKQNLLSRVEHVVVNTYFATVNGEPLSITAESEKDALSQIREHLKVKRLPRGIELVLQPTETQDTQPQQIEEKV